MAVLDPLGQQGFPLGRKGILDGLCGDAPPEPGDAVAPLARGNSRVGAYASALAPVNRPATTLPAGGGEMSERIRAMDWSNSPLGPIQAWPQSLRTAVEIMLSSRYAMFVWWGRHLTNLYNDAYRPFLGEKHPQSLGQSARDVWAEIWDQIGPRTQAVLDRGESTFDEALLLVMERFGYPEETYFTFSYSPVRDERGGVGGIFCAVTDETRRVIGERRLRLLREVAATSTDKHTAEQVCAAAAQCVTGQNRDLPFLLLYLTDPGGQRATLAAQVNLVPGSELAPAVIEFGCSVPAWPLAASADACELLLVEDLGARFDCVPTGAWDRPAQRAAVIALRERGQAEASGFLIVGINPYLRFDEEYRGFLRVLAGQIGADIANARAYEEERKRAEALAEIDRAKTLFFSNVSHEFRTPLTLMLGPLEDALAAQPPMDQRERLEVAHRNAHRLLKLVNSLLDFSRIEAGRAQAFYEPVDLARFTAELASNFRSACERAGLQLIVDCASLPAPVHVDRDMWEKIVLNLLSNAFKFTFEGHIAVRLRAVDGSAELSVHDTGVGIPEQELPRLFERFHRIEGQKSRTTEGSGIGLALVQELVKLHHGSIKVSSKPGAGATFAVTVPFGAQHLPATRCGAGQGLASTPVRADAYVQEALGWLQGETMPSIDAADVGAGFAEGGLVLLADDNADMRAYVRRLLGPGFAVEAVADGRAALDAIGKRRPDLVITDVMMPRLDGFGLVRAIRDDPALRDLPIIMLSARAGEESRVEGLQAGADDYLVKPFSAREFVARVCANLKLARVRRQGMDALRESEHRYRELAEERARVGRQFETLLNQAPLGVYLVDSDLRIREVNPVARPVFRGIADLIGRDFDEVIHAMWPKPHADEMIRRFRHTLETGESYERPEWIYERLDRKVTEFYEWRIDRIQLAEDRYGVVCYFRDISAHVAARDRLKLLIEELNHRVKNTLAAVQSIAVQTLRNASTTAEGRRMLEARILALASAHDVLTQGHWEGADIYDVLQGSLAAYRTNGQDWRLNIQGPNIHLLPRAALALSLALHELATNAAKYGALSNGTGRVDVVWKISDTEPSRFCLTWAESGGPPVKVPRRRGFGSRLIERGLARDLDGDIRLEFAPGGVICTIAVPMDAISSGPGRKG